MKLHLDLLLERKASVIERVLGIVAAYAGDVHELRIEPARDPAMARLTALVQTAGNPRELLVALLQVSAVREAAVLRRIQCHDSR